MKCKICKAEAVVALRSHNAAFCPDCYKDFFARQVERGIEGEVRLILKLGADGVVDDVSIAASSGYPILDNAAIKAAYAMGRLAGTTSRELILPVIFRLQ